jgi:hypothetical protein
MLFTYKKSNLREWMVANIREDFKMSSPLIYVQMCSDIGGGTDYEASHKHAYTVFELSSI